MFHVVLDLHGKGKGGLCLLLSLFTLGRKGTNLFFSFMIGFSEWTINEREEQVQVVVTMHAGVGYQ